MRLFYKKNIFRRLWIHTFFVFVFLSSTHVFGEDEKTIKNLPSELKPMAEKSLLLDVALIGDKRIVAVGERGHILISEDGGIKWRQVIIPTRATLTAVFFIDDSHGWAVGHDSIILETRDRGESWNVLFFDPKREQPLMDVCFKDENFGLAVGAYGLYLETKDGGKTWNDKYFESLDDPEFGLAHFNSITISKEGVMYMAGEAGFLGVSKDMGVTWEPIQKPYFGSYFTLIVTQKKSLIAAGLRGNIYRSTDQGTSWAKVDAHTISTINSSIQLANGQIILTGLGSTILISTDDGENFKEISRSDRISISSVVGLENNVLILAGDGGVKRITY